MPLSHRSSAMGCTTDARRISRHRRIKIKQQYDPRHCSPADNNFHPHCKSQPQCAGKIPPPRRLRKLPNARAGKPALRRRGRIFQIRAARRRRTRVVVNKVGHHRRALVYVVRRRDGLPFAFLYFHSRAVNSRDKTFRLHPALPARNVINLRRQHSAALFDVQINYREGVRRKSFALRRRHSQFRVARAQRAGIHRQLQFLR